MPYRGDDDNVVGVAGQMRRVLGVPPAAVNSRTGGAGTFFLATKELRMSRRSLRIVAITAATMALVSHLTAQTPAVSLADYQRAVAERDGRAPLSPGVL